MVLVWYWKEKDLIIQNPHIDVLFYGLYANAFDWGRLELLGEL